MAAPRKKAASATATPRATRPPKPTAKTIRNLRNCPVHLRIQGAESEKKFRKELKPRGERGDVVTIPANLIETFEFQSGINVLYEIITSTEAQEIWYGPVGYQGRQDALRVERPEDTTFMVAEDVDNTARKQPYEQLRRDSKGHAIYDGREDVGAGPRYADVQGSDRALHEGLREGAREPAGRPSADDMLPPGAFPQRVIIEKASPSQGR